MKPWQSTFIVTINSQSKIYHLPFQSKSCFSIYAKLKTNISGSTPKAFAATRAGTGTASSTGAAAAIAASGGERAEPRRTMGSTLRGKKLRFSHHFSSFTPSFWWFFERKSEISVSQLKTNNPGLFVQSGDTPKRRDPPGASAKLAAQFWQKNLMNCRNLEPSEKHEINGICLYLSWFFTIFGAFCITPMTCIVLCLSYFSWWHGSCVSGQVDGTHSKGLGELGTQCWHQTFLSATSQEWLHCLVSGS